MGVAPDNLYSHTKRSKFKEDNLLCNGVINGVALLTKDGCCAYSTDSIDESQDWSAFMGLFNKEKNVLTSLTLLLAKNNPVHFTVFRQTECSIYGISEGSLAGIIVCSYPHGTIVCVCKGSRVAMDTAIKQVEDFADILRA